MSDTAGILPALVPIRTASYATMASAAVVGYDTLMTFWDEVELVWMQKWRWVNLLYFFNRYFTVVDVVMNVVACLDPNMPATTVIAVTDLADNWNTALRVASAEALQILRVCALYPRNRLLHIFLWLLIALYLCGTLVLEMVALSTAQVLPNPFPWVFGVAIGVPCYDKELELIAQGISVVSVVNETLIFGLVLSRTYSHVRAGRGETRLLTLLLRDGCVYFSVTLVVMFALAFASFVPGAVRISYVLCELPGGALAGQPNLHNGFIQQTIAPGLAVVSLLSSRLFFNLRAHFLRTIDHNLLTTRETGPTQESHEPTQESHEMTSWAYDT